MGTNSLATEAQRRIEDRAMALLLRPDIQRVRGIVTMLWQNVLRATRPTGSTT